MASRPADLKRSKFRSNYRIRKKREGQIRVFVARRGRRGTRIVLAGLLSDSYLLGGYVCQSVVREREQLAMHKTSIIIPTLEAERSLDEQVAALRRQTWPVDEVIVLDSSSSDHTVRRGRHAGCRTMIIPRSEFSHGRTRNLGAQLSRGNILVFMTQDALPADQDFLANLVSPIVAQQAVASYGRQIPYPHASAGERFTRCYNYPDESFIKTIDQMPKLGMRTYFFSNVASALSRESFMQLGGFPNKVIVNEDMLFCSRALRAGYAVAYQAEARVYHSHDYALHDYFRRYFDIGVFFSQAAERLHGTHCCTTEGLHFMGEQLLYLLREGACFEIPRCLTESGLKYLAFHMGKRAKYLPPQVNQRFSGQTAFWGQLSRENGLLPMAD